MMDSIDREIQGLDINMNSIESNKNKKEEFPGQFEMKNKLEALKKKQEENEERLMEAKRTNLQLNGTLAASSRRSA